MNTNSKGASPVTNQTRYVRCKVSAGFFDTEYYVIVRDSAAFVDRSNVRVHEAPLHGSEVDGEVLSYVVDFPEEKNEALVELSGEPAVGPLRTWVPKSILSAAKSRENRDDSQQ